MYIVFGWGIAGLLLWLNLDWISANWELALLALFVGERLIWLHTQVAKDDVIKTLGYHISDVAQRQDMRIDADADSRQRELIDCLSDIKTELQTQDVENCDY